jgi:D-arginine dehydrogenase
MTAPIIIVGGGFAGVATAWHLTRSGTGPVLILERDLSCGQQSSGRNAGMIRTLIPKESVQRIALESARNIAAPPDDLPVDGIFRRTGGIILGSGEDVSRLREAADRSRAAGREVVELRTLPDEVAHWVNPDDFEAAFLTPDDGVADIHGLLQGYLKGALAGGAEFRGGVTVTDLVVRAGRVQGVETSSGTIEGRAVVNAAGAWAGEVGARGSSESFGLAPRRRHLHSTGPVPGVHPDLPFVWNDTEGYYFRPESGGFLLSGCDETTLPPGEPPVDPEADDRLAQKLLSHAPALADLPVRTRWAGLRTFAPDGLPILRWDPVLPGLYWMAALGGHGVTLSFTAAESAATEIRAALETSRP